MDADIELMRKQVCWGLFTKHIYVASEQEQKFFDSKQEIIDCYPNPSLQQIKSNLI